MFSLQRYSTDSAVTFDLCDLNQSNLVAVAKMKRLLIHEACWGRCR